MSYHSTIFTNKEFRKLFSEEELRNMQLISIRGKPAKTKGKVRKNRDGTLTVFGSDFVAKVAIKDNTQCSLVQRTHLAKKRSFLGQGIVL